MYIFTVQFIKAVLERAIKTAAQTAIATIGTTAAFNEVDWRVVGLVVATATVLSVLTSIATAASTDGSPSLNGSEALTPVEPKRAVLEQPVVPTSTVVIDGVTKTLYSDGTTTTDPTNLG